MLAKFNTELKLDNSYSLYIRGQYDEVKAFASKQHEFNFEIKAQYLSSITYFDYNYVESYNQDMHPLRVIDINKDIIFYVIHVKNRGLMYNVPSFFFDIIDDTIPSTWIYHSYSKGISVPKNQRNDYGEKYRIYAIWGPKQFVLDNEYTFNAIQGYIECDDIK
ncbi:hypothetical protein FH022_15130 [Listeria monocytogenes]|nr:hypothetical protein [Listeria monocytogenes]